MKKFVTYIFKLFYLAFSWFVIVTSFSGNIDEDLFFISIFMYSGGILFDCLFYMYDAFERNSPFSIILRVTSVITSAISILLTIFSILASKYIIIKQINKYYYFVLDKEMCDGLLTLYPTFSNFSINLSDTMLCIVILGTLSLLPALLLELDSYKRIKNDNHEDNSKKEGR